MVVKIKYLITTSRKISDLYTKYFLQRLLEGILEVKEPEVVTTLAEKDKVRL